MHLPTDNIEKSLPEYSPFIAGIDEAGRGPLAGPVVAAACILNFEKIDELPQEKKQLIRDSKKLSAKQREEVFEIIIQNSWYGIGEVEHKIIDEINILNATLLAMRLAVDKIPIVPKFLLVDGNKSIPRVKTPQKTVINGDGLSISIAAASIIAKVTRDKTMMEMHQKYPQYCFNEHSGYGTAKHLKLITQYGPSPIHRLSFSPFTIKKQENTKKLITR